MRFCTWNVKNMYMLRSLTAVARELERYKLDLVGVQEVSWDKEGAVRAGDYTRTFFYRNTSVENRIFVRHRITSVVKKVEFVCDRMSCIVLRGRRYNIFFLNKPAPTEVKSDVSKYSFCEKLEQVFEDFPKYRKKILSDFNAKLGRVDSFKQTIRNKS